MLQAPMKNSNEKFISRLTVTNCGAQQSRRNCKLHEWQKMGGVYLITVNSVSLSLILDVGRRVRDNINKNENFDEYGM